MSSSSHPQVSREDDLNNANEEVFSAQKDGSSCSIGKTTSAVSTVAPTSSLASSSCGVVAGTSLASSSSRASAGVSPISANNASAASSFAVVHPPVVVSSRTTESPSRTAASAKRKKNAAAAAAAESAQSSQGQQGPQSPGPGWGGGQVIFKAGGPGLGDGHQQGATDSPAYHPGSPDVYSHHGTASSWSAAHEARSGSSGVAAEAQRPAEWIRVDAENTHSSRGPTGESTDQALRGCAISGTVVADGPGAGSSPGGPGSSVGASVSFLLPPGSSHAERPMSSALMGSGQSTPSRAGASPLVGSNSGSKDGGGPSHLGGLGESESETDFLLKGTGLAVPALEIPPRPFPVGAAPPMPPGTRNSLAELPLKSWSETRPQALPGTTAAAVAPAAPGHDALGAQQQLGDVAGSAAGRDAQGSAMPAVPAVAPVPGAVPWTLGNSPNSPSPTKWDVHAPRALNAAEVFY